MSFAAERARADDSHTIAQAARVAAHRICDKRNAAEATTNVVYRAESATARVVQGKPFNAKTGSPMRLRSAEEQAEIQAQIARLNRDLKPSAWIGFAYFVFFLIAGCFGTLFALWLAGARLHP